MINFFLLPLSTVNCNGIYWPTYPNKKVSSFLLELNWIGWWNWDRKIGHFSNRSNFLLTLILHCHGCRLCLWKKCLPSTTLLIWVSGLFLQFAPLPSLLLLLLVKPSTFTLSLLHIILQCHSAWCWKFQLIIY